MGNPRSLLRFATEPTLRRRGLVGGLVLGLTALPLFGTLGYENAFVLAPIFSLLGVAVGVDVVLGARAGRGGGLGPLCGRAALELLTLHATAIAILLLGQIWQRGCDPLGGLTFYAAGPLLSSALGCVCGLWGGALGKTRRRALLLGLVPMGLSTALGLWRLYADPVVYAFDPFFGYFSGSVYDESVGVGDRYITYRLYNAVAAATALLGWALFVNAATGRLHQPLRDAATARSRTSLVALALFALATTVATGSAALNSTALGFTADTESIGEVLSLTHQTEHFVIHYAPRSPEARTIAEVAAEHEFAWAKLAAEMGREPARKVHSFLFQSPDQKRSLMGAGTVQVAAPWRYHIYLDHREFPHPVLHHELAHVFGTTIGDDLFGVARSGLRLNIGLIEGFATAMGPRPSDRLDLHDQVAVLSALGHRPSIGSIMGPGFFSKSSGVAYTTAGSFCRWLIDTRGFEGMATLYRSAGDFEAAYGKPLETLEKEWLVFLEARPGVREQDIEAQALRFQRPSVFSRPCAHKVAAVRSEIGRSQRRGLFDEAVLGFGTLCELEPKDPAHQLGLAFGLAEARRLDAARTVLNDAAAMEELTVTTLAAIAERRGDVELFEGNLGAALTAYDEALAQPLWEDPRRGVTLKRLAAATPALAPLLVRYFGLFDIQSDGLQEALSRFHTATLVADLPEHEALGQYLIARQLLNIQETAGAALHLDRALELADQLPDDDFRREARIQRVSVAVAAGEFDRASALLATLESEPGIGNGHRMAYALWRDRVAFFRSYPPNSPDTGH